MAKQVVFGLGALIGEKIVSTGVVTPVEFGILQEVSIKFDGSTKKLQGQSAFPADVARTGLGISWTAKAADIRGGLLNDLFFNGTVTTGQVRLIRNELGDAVTGNQYTVAQTALFKEDLGVKYKVSKNPLTRVAATPGVGEYSVTVAGVYSFNTADTDADVGVYITYTYTAATGKTVKITNPLMGDVPTFAMHLFQPYKLKEVYWKLNRNIFKSLDWAGKNEDYTIPGLEGEAYADDNDDVGLFAATDY